MCTFWCSLCPVSAKRWTQKLPINKLQKAVSHEGQWKLCSLQYSCHSTLPLDTWSFVATLPQNARWGWPQLTIWWPSCPSSRPPQGWKSCTNFNLSGSKFGMSTADAGWILSYTYARRKGNKQNKKHFQAIWKFNPKILACLKTNVESQSHR